MKLRDLKIAEGLIALGQKLLSHERNGVSLNCLVAIG